MHEFLYLLWCLWRLEFIPFCFYSHWCDLNNITLMWRRIMEKIPRYCKFNVSFVWLRIAEVPASNFKFQISCFLCRTPLKYYSALSLTTLYEGVLLTKTAIHAPKKLSTLGSWFVYRMEEINFWYSMKNIEIPQIKTYLSQLIEKIEMIIKRMRRKDLCNGKKETNGIKIEW